MALSISRNLVSKLSPGISAQCLKVNSLAVFCAFRKRNFASAKSTYETLAVTVPHKHVVHVELNRPDKRNSMNDTLWREIRECFMELKKDTECRAIVLSGAGKMFTSGLDFMNMGELSSMVTSDEDIARKAKVLQELISSFQDSFSALEKCPKPVIAAVHSACVGAGVDLICSADVRYCSEDAWFQVKEVDVGLAADVGTLQRFPRIVGNDSLVRELVYTARKLSSSDAARLGLVSGIFPTKEDTLKAAMDLAQVIATKSPVAVQGSKLNLIYSRDHNVPESLKFMSYWNMTMLQSEDLMKSAMAAVSRDTEPPEFKDL